MKRSIAAALAATAFACAPASATVYQFEAFMTGAAETSPTSSLATGSASATLDTATHLFSWNVSFQGPFIGTPNAMHFHGRLAGDPPNQGLPGTNAGVRISLGVASNPNIGSVDLTTLTGYGSFMQDDIVAGKWYVNLHSSIYPAGEIRGQLQLVPEPGTWALMIAGLGGLLLLRRRVH